MIATFPEGDFDEEEYSVLLERFIRTNNKALMNELREKINRIANYPLESDCSADEID